MPKDVAAVVLALVLAAAARASEPPATNWPQWRGPGFAGSVDFGTYPAGWSEGGHLSQLAWKVELPGRGCSTPITWGDHILVTAPIDGRDGVVDLDLAGNLRWQTALGIERPGKHRNGSGCNPSAVTDGTSIFVYFKSGMLAGLDFSGRVLWQTDLQQQFAPDTLYWDVGTSPVLTDQYVVGTVMHGGESGLAAFEKQTGKMAWKVARNYDCPIEGDHSYTTPLVIEHGGGQAILVWGAEHLTAHRAEDGELLWSCGGFNPDRNRNWVSVGSAVVAGDMAVVSYGRGTRLAGVRLGGSGDVTETHRPWTRYDLGAFVPTPAVHDGKIYLLGDRGEITCVDPRSGKTLGSGALPKHRTNYYASPTVADGKLYAAREDGVVFVARLADGFPVLSENPMGEQTIASPVPVGGCLLLRGGRHLFCVGPSVSVH